MSVLLDTNVLSEFLRAKPAVAVAAWLNSVPDTDQLFSVLSIGEIRYGIERVDTFER